MLLGIFSQTIYSQVITSVPVKPFVDDTLTIIYDAAQGNAALEGYTGDVYMHTGIITTESSGSSDWKHVKTAWGDNTPETKMTSLGNDIYSTCFHIRSFYSIDSSEIVLSLAFVFRSENSDIVGRNADGSDIFLPVAQQNPTYMSYRYANDTLKIICNEGNISITPYNATIFNVRSLSNGSSPDTSQIIVASKQAVNTSFSQENQYLHIQTDSVSVFIDTMTLEIKSVYRGDTVLYAPKAYSFTSGGLLNFSLTDNERIYGGGSHAVESDRRGNTFDIYNQAHYGYSYGQKNLNITLPFICSSNNYAILADNYSPASWDIDNTSPGETVYTFSEGQANLFFIFGKDYADITEQTSFLTGHQPLPPIWALGYIQSKYGYQSQAEAESIVNSIISAGYPLDALVLDLYWFGNTSEMGNLDWNYSNFPNPVSMISNFANKGVKTINITEPYFTLSSSNWSFADNQGYFAENSSGDSYIINGFWAGNASLLDIFNPSAQNWFWQFYNNRTDEGVAGWWTDLGEPESHPSDMIHYGNKTAQQIHNIYGLEWEKMIYSNWKLDFPDKRLFNLSRSGFLGMQRYGTFPWSGDIQRSFDGLRAQIPIMLSMGLSGIAYMHSDIGGFTGIGYNEELFTRWVQLGCFAPVFRIHGSGIETAPTAYSTATQNIVKKYIKLRYSLLPYNYTLAYKNSETGIPLARPMDFYQPQNSILQNNNDQYFWGDNFIIAPVIQSNQSQRELILSDGNWIDWNSDIIYTGNATYTISTPINDIGIFVKAGSFIPTVLNLQSTDDYTGDTLFIKYYPDIDTPESSYTWFDDDKKSTISLTNNEYTLITFNGFELESQTQITISDNGQIYPEMPLSHQFIYEIHRYISDPLSVFTNDIELNEYTSLNSLLSDQNGWYYSTNENILYVKSEYVYQPQHILINKNPESNDAFSVQSFSVFPNPGTDYINIASRNKNLMDYTISITDITGKTLIYKHCSERTIQIPTSHLSSGIYIIKISSPDSFFDIKWIKQ